jgi:ATP-dependent DNA ligase
MTYVIFDLLRCHERDLTGQTYEERRHELVNLGLDGSTWTTCEAFEDGRALFAAVCELGYEGVVAKDRDSQYGSNEGGWVKIKNPGYWRRDAEIEGMQRSRQRRRGAAWSKTI